MYALLPTRIKALRHATAEHLGELRIHTTLEFARVTHLSLVSSSQIIENLFFFLS